MKLIIMSIIVSVLIVIVCYVGFSWYYSRWDPEPFEAPEFVRGVAPPASQIHNLQSLVDSNSMSGTHGLLGENRTTSSDPTYEESLYQDGIDVEKMKDFSYFIMNHSVFDYGDDPLAHFTHRYSEASNSDERSQVGLEIADYFIAFHDFMQGLRKRYDNKQIPFAAGSEGYNMVVDAIDLYTQFVEESDDPFLLNAMESDRPKRDPNMTDVEKRYEEWKQSR